MRIIITRPLERAKSLEKKLEELGVEMLLAPMLKIENCAFEVPEGPLQAIIFTSVQGVEATAGYDSLHIFPALTVGSKTAGAAAKAGFQTVYNADGDVEALYDLILEKGNTGKGLLLHLAGEQTTGNLVERLQEKGFQAERRKVYIANAADSLPASVLEKIRARAVDAVLFFSTRTAHIFNQIARENSLEDALGRAFTLCLSENIASEAKKLPWKKVLVADNPTEQSMIDLLRGLRK
ncbi:MAG: uroporphyrinogen-III synthase [Proteobacteria bacterium]|nr:uroporphyrinogen-III synthase [Pseudomonadota bacterium]